MPQRARARDNHAAVHERFDHGNAARYVSHRYSKQSPVIPRHEG
jgi:hypothetical protein